MPEDGAGRPVKVCIAVPWDQEFGGVASVVGNLAKYLESRGSKAYFAHPEGTNRLTPKRTKWGFPGFALRMRGQNSVIQRNRRQKMLFWIVAVLAL